MRVRLKRPRLNFVQVLLMPIILSFLVVGLSAWLFALIEVDNAFLLANPGWVTVLGFILIGGIILSLIGILYCFVLLVKVIVQEVGYDSIVQALEKEYHRIKKE